MRLRALACVGLCLLVVLATQSCSQQVGDRAKAEIYAAAITQIYLGDGVSNFPVVYLRRLTDDRAGDLGSDDARSVTLSASIQASVLYHLRGFPADFIWVDSPKQVPSQEGNIMGGGAAIHFSNIYRQKDGSVLVYANLSFSGLGARGETYILRFVKGTWTIVGTTGKSDRS